MRYVLCTVLAAALAVSTPAHSQAFPSKPVRVVLGYTSGGTADIVARLVAEKLAGALGQPVIVENRPGASGNIAAQTVAKAPADGHTLLLGATAEMAINRHVMKEMGFNPETDFTPIALGFHVPLALLVPAKSPHASLKDLLEAARRAPASGPVPSPASARRGTTPGKCSP